MKLVSQRSSRPSACFFNEMDSSKKKNVKAVQPVGQDVGSHVQAEITAGNYHFIYAKTYNKATQTSLDVLAPKKGQFTGREAHEEVERILSETVDLALWDALLVEQGEKVALANFQDSTGLAKALDEAAGSGSTGGEDTGLYGVVQIEYEKYFTLKTGKPRFSGVEGAHQKAKALLEESQQALTMVEEDSQSHDRCATETRRLTSMLPGLKAKMEEHEKNWTSIKSLKEQVETKEKELSSARELQKAVTDSNSERLNLIKETAQSEKDLNTSSANIKPLKASAEEFKKQFKSTKSTIVDLKKWVKAARAELTLAQDDEKQINNLAALAKNKHQLEQLDSISRSLKAKLKVTGSIAIDNTMLMEFREAERKQDIAGGKRDFAATIIALTAEKKLDLELDDEAIQLDETKTETRTIASDMLIHLPGVASIQLSPPPSVAELQATADDAKDAFTNLKNQFGVKNLKDAESLNEQRIAAQREIDRLKDQEHTVVNGISREEIEQAVTSLQSDYDSYVQQRVSTQAIPESVGKASKRVSDAKEELEGKEESLDMRQVKSEALQAKHEKVDNQLRIAQQNLAGIEAALEVKQDQLEKARATESDKTLAKRAVETSVQTGQLEKESKDLKASLSESSPETIEVLLENAKDVYKRANSDLVLEEQNLAVLIDRLQQAQADGRYEIMEAAERELEEREATLTATHRRAKAVELLWNTLNKHRDTARQAYVRPLKEAIERLGAIVFGSGFEVGLGEDWSVLSRTLNSKTLPFDALSVGAKEQLGILTRLAAGQIVSKQGGVPLIIDDALGFSDPSRLETMGAAIAAAGKQCQIIILTCTPGRFTHVGSAEVVKL